MNNKNQLPIESLAVPQDFPIAGDAFENWSDWVVCMQAAIDLVAECIDQAARTPLVPRAEILAVRNARMIQAGWGTEAQVHWITKRAAAMLGWPLP